MVYTYVHSRGRWLWAFTQRGRKTFYFLRMYIYNCICVYNCQVRYSIYVHTTPTPIYYTYYYVHLVQATYLLYTITTIEDKNKVPDDR